MNAYSREVADLQAAATLDDIRAIARRFSAQPSGEDGILYSRPVGAVSAHDIAVDLARQTDAPIIDATDRAKFLSSTENEIKASARRIFQAKGLGPIAAKQAADDFLYGDANVGPGDPTSLQRCLWGEASHEFASSLRGDIKLVASAAGVDRVFGRVELPAIMSNPDVTSVGGKSIDELRVAYRQGGAVSILPALQQQFVEAAPKGVYDLPVKQNATKKAMVSREFVDAMSMHSADALPSRELIAVLSEAPTGLRAPTAASEIGNLRPAPGAIRRIGAATGLTGLGIAASVYDAHETGKRVSTLLEQDNPIAAQSELVHYGARGIAGWAGGVGTVGLLGVGGGTLALAAADAYVLTKAADRASTLWDQHRINHQTDRDGVAWRYTGADWVRDARADLRDDGIDALDRIEMAALPDKARELDYLASGVAVAQALGRTTAQAPFVQPAGEHDAAHLRQRDWTRDAQGGWQRMVADDVDRNDVPTWRPEQASAQRAAELDRQAARTIDANIRQGGAGIAAAYEIEYRRQGWSTIAPLPTAVSSALDADHLQASDGQSYRRDAQGGWRHDGDAASARIASELEATRDRLVPALQRHADAIAVMPEWQPPTPEQRDRAQLLTEYTRRHVAPQSEQFEAAYRAVQATRVDQGLDAATMPLTLAPDVRGGFSIESPIQHLRRDADGAVRVAAVTSAEEIAFAKPAIRRAENGGLDAHAVDTAYPDRPAPSSEVAPLTFGHAPRVGASGRRDDAHAQDHVPAHSAPRHAAASASDPMLQQIRDGVAALDRSLGQHDAAASNAMTASLYALAKENGLTRVDHVVLSVDNGRVGRGENVFVVQGGMTEATNRVAHMRTADAVAAPVERSMQRASDAQQRDAAVQQVVPHVQEQQVRGAVHAHAR